MMRGENLRGIVADADEVLEHARPAWAVPVSTIAPVLGPGGAQERDEALDALSEPPLTERAPVVPSAGEEQAAADVEASIEAARVCPTCHGRGGDVYVCLACGGTGRR